MRKPLTDKHIGPIGGFISGCSTPEHFAGPNLALSTTLVDEYELPSSSKNAMIQTDFFLSSTVSTHKLWDLIKDGP